MKTFTIFGLVVASIFAAIGLVVFWAFLQIPSAQEIRGCLVTKMRHVNLCPGSKDYVPLAQISQYMQRSVILSEDASFWQHRGFDLEQLQKSAEENLQKGVYKRGGSTISQQLAKNMFLSEQKSLFRKGLEALITIKIENNLSKKEILERYLNVVEFGENIYGIKAAAQNYFRKAPADLDPVESAYLTMLLPSPIKYSVSFRKKTLTPFARQRITRILEDMEQTQRITAEQHTSALARMETLFGPAIELPPGTVLEDELEAESGEDESASDATPAAPTPSANAPSTASPAAPLDEDGSVDQAPTNQPNGDVHGEPSQHQDETKVPEESPTQSP